MIETANPCTLCTKVADPQNCENKQCPLWRSWFTAKWNQTRKLFGTGPVKADPCLDCVWNGPLCTAPCTTRIAYEQEETR